MPVNVSRHRITPNTQLPKVFDAIMDLHKVNGASKIKAEKDHPSEPESIRLNQIELVSANIPARYAKAVLALQEALPRTSIVAPDGEEIGAGSAVSINPAGVYLTAFHATPGLSSSLMDLLIGGGTNRLFIDIPGQEPLPAKIITYDGHLDVALLALERDAISQDPRTFLSLDTDKQTAGARIYKIGHYKGSLPAYLSDGKVLDPGARPAELFGNHCPECESKKRLVVSNNPIGRGDSGGGLLNAEGEVSAVSTMVMYLLKNDKETSSPNYLQGYEFVSIGTSVVESVLPFLEKELGKKDFKKLIDGDELVFKKPLKVNQMPRLPFGIILIELPPD